MTNRQTRQSVKDGRNALIQATVSCLKEFGLHGTSVRRIAEKGGVTPGLLTHHFSGKEALIIETYRVASLDMLAAFMNRVEQSGDDPTARLYAFIDASFLPQNMDAGQLKMWLGFWTLVLTDDSAALMHQQMDQHYQQALADLLKAACDHQNNQLSAESVTRLSVALSALLDGLWLNGCLNPGPEQLELKRRAALEIVSKALRP